MPLDCVKRTLGFVPTWFQTFAGTAVRRRSLLSGAFKAEFPDHDGARMFLSQFDVAGQLAGRDPLNQALYLWSKSILPNHVLSMLGDRMEMAHSIEGRVPFLDHHVIECLRQVPVLLKIRGTSEKHMSARRRVRRSRTPCIAGRNIRSSRRR